MTDYAPPVDSLAKRGRGGPSITVLLVLLLGLPIFFFGMATTISFIKFMNSPVLNGQVPVWVLIVLTVIVLLILKRRQTSPYMV